MSLYVYTTFCYPFLCQWTLGSLPEFGYGE